MTIPASHPNRVRSAPLNAPFRTLKHRLRPLALTLLVAGLASACDEDPTAASDAPAFAASAIASVRLDLDTLKLNAGGKATVNCQPRGPTGGDALGRNCNWRSRDAAVATVSGNGTRVGTVTGVANGATWVVANAEQSRDSVRVLVGDASPPPPPPAGVVAVVLTPATVRLAAGGVQQFGATGRSSSGATVPVAVAWSGTGGNIDATGKYTAGQSAGSFRVIAKAGTLADTSAVTVTPADSPPPPPPPPGIALRGCPTGGFTRLVSVSTVGALNAALGSALPGDQIRVAAGTYNGALSLNRSGTASAELTLCALPGVKPVLKGGFTGTPSYTTITGLVFEGPTGGNQVYLHDFHHSTFSGNEIRNGNYHAGLSIDEMHDVTVAYNYIHHNGVDVSHDHGIYWKTTTGTGNRVIGNLLVANASRGISLHDNKGAGVYDVVVAHNTMFNNGSQGLLINNGDRNIVVNNVLAFNGDRNNQKQIRIVVGSKNQIRNNLTFSTTSARAGIADEAGSVVSGNVIANPLFMSSSDLHLQGSSPAVNLGLPVYTVSPDLDGTARTGGAPTAGAYER